MKKLCKHEKIALILTIIAVLLMLISVCPGGWAEATGILQGLSTGLLSGVVLLFVTGIKDREVRELSNIYDFYSKSNHAFMTIMESYNTLYHKTYHGKKENMSFGAYAALVDEAYNKCYLAYKELHSLDCSFREKDCIAENILKFTDTLTEYLSELGQKINYAKENGHDKQLLNEARETLCELQNKVYSFYSKSVKKMWQIHELRERTENSIL